MRSVTYSMGVSLDGYIAGPSRTCRWIVEDPGPSTSSWARRPQNRHFK